MVCGPLRGGGQAAPTAVTPDMKVQAARGHPSASVDILLSPRGVDEPRAGMLKRWTKASRHPGWFVGSCLRRQ